MTRSRLLVGLLLLSAVLACFAGWLWIESRPRGMWGRFEKVRVGMSREEVIHTVGGPPGDYSNGMTARRYPLEFWATDEALLFVDYYADGTVREVNVIILGKTLTDRIRRWLGL
jgi:hypothetical protein